MRSREISARKTGRVALVSSANTGHARLGDGPVGWSAGTWAASQSSCPAVRDLMPDRISVLAGAPKAAILGKAH